MRGFHHLSTYTEHMVLEIDLMYNKWAAITFDEDLKTFSYC